MITEEIKKQIAAAMKSGDKTRLSTLKLLSSELHNAEIDNHGPLMEDQELEILKREVKKRRDAIEMYDKAGASDRSQQEMTELEILQEFMPQQLTDEELEKLIESAITESGAQGVKDFGKVMGLAIGKAGNLAEGKRISEFVRKKLA